MSSKPAAVLLIVLLGTFAFVLLCVPAELPQAPAPQAINSSIPISYGETWEEAQVHSGNESYYAQIREWMENNADDFRTVAEMYYSAQHGTGSPVYGIQLGRAVTVLVPSGTTIAEIDRIYGWMNESMAKAGLYNVAVQFRGSDLIIRPEPVVTRTPEQAVKTYGDTWEEIWEREGEEYNYTRLWNWYEENRYAGDVWEKANAYYGSAADNPINRIEYGWTITILTDPLSVTEMDRIYGWVNESMEAAGLRGIPVQFRYGGVFTVSGLTLTAEKDSVIHGPPQPNYLRSVLLILCIAGVATLGFSRMLELPEDPASRPQRIAAFIAEHPGCSQKEIADATGFSRGSILYHLKRLEQKKIVRQAAYVGSIRYFPKKDDDSVMERTLRTVLAQEKPARVIREITKSPGIGRKELAKRIGITETTLVWHLERLHDAGIIDRYDEGCTLSSEAAAVWELLDT
ncbi:winged helix-turn-helix transcriptional regulator [Methanocorpusculum sp. MG]|uniref:Winged helix-turn-helix transcriptional regulator n=1 Tax=Methanocorpusculum petauri TaxID=3002863 RepID=A0ABT4IIC9_9EURY|nr:winged helix-turn-helix transcriptional regulator [Methanocorpusculum petauri]MCZ0861501.1 winged helix-turn-helix transcriptional regulator [Methanocorpusculum petauri]